MNFRGRARELYELYKQEFLRYDELLAGCNDVIDNCEELVGWDFEDFNNAMEEPQTRAVDLFKIISC